VLIDVRSPEEWRQSGIPANALAIALHQAGGLEAFQQAVLKAVKGHRDQPIAVICAAGSRSHRAQGLLEQAGFTQVQDVSEGMFGHDNLPGWIKRGLPVVSCKDC
jgi:rhodanese-related sulfurtransferase